VEEPLRQNKHQLVEVKQEDEWLLVEIRPVVESDKHLAEVVEVLIKKVEEHDQ
jgi:hypothetical protein